MERSEQSTDSPLLPRLSEVVANRWFKRYSRDASLLNINMFAEFAQQRMKMKRENPDLFKNLKRSGEPSIIGGSLMYSLLSAAEESGSVEIPTVSQSTIGTLPYDRRESGLSPRTYARDIIETVKLENPHLYSILMNDVAGLFLEHSTMTREEVKEILQEAVTTYQILREQAAKDRAWKNLPSELKQAVESIPLATETTKPDASSIISQEEQYKESQLNNLLPEIDISPKQLAEISEISIRDFESLGFSPRGYNALSRANITTVGAIFQLSKEDLFAIRNFGELSAMQLGDILQNLLGLPEDECPKNFLGLLIVSGSPYSD